MTSPTGRPPIRRPRRRQWTIISAVLGVVVLVIGGAMFAGYQWVQGKSYLAPQNGNVAIFRGINSNFVGISLSSPYQNTGVPLSKLRPAEQAAIQATVSYASLVQAQEIVTHLRSEVTSCGEWWNQLKEWQQRNALYEAQLTHWAHLPANQKAATPAPTAPGARPTTQESVFCAPASAFGIPASALPPGTTNTR